MVAKMVIVVAQILKIIKPVKIANEAKYLGFLIGRGVTAMNKYNLVIKKVEKHIAAWIPFRAPAPFQKTRAYNIHMATLFSYLDQALIQPEKVTARILFSFWRIVRGVLTLSHASKQTSTPNQNHTPKKYSQSYPTVVPKAPQTNPNGHNNLNLQKKSLLKHIPKRTRWYTILKL